jgi:hypothetical protein
MFDVNTMNGSRVTANTAGMESTAKSTSVLSITSSTMKSGVAERTPFSTTKNFSP